MGRHLAKNIDVFFSITLCLMLMHTIMQLLSTTLIESNIYLSLAATTLAIALYICHKKEKTRHSLSIVLLKIAALLYLIRSYLLIIIPFQTESINYIILGLELIGMLCVSAFVTKELEVDEAKSDNIGLNANIFLLFAAISITGGLVFSQQLILFIKTHPWPIIKTLLLSYVCFAFTLLAIKLIKMHAKDIISNVLSLSMASFLCLHYTLASAAQLTTSENLSFIYECLSRSTLIISGTSLVLYIWHNPEIINVEKIIEKRAINVLLLSGVFFMMTAIPFALFLNHFKIVRITAISLMTGTLICLIIIAIRLLLLLTEARKKAKEFWAEARIDGITTLANRRMLLESVNEQVAPAIVAVVDLQDFKAINDLYGRDIGNKLLKAFGHELKAIINKYYSHDKNFPPLVARLSSDDFAIILSIVDNFNDTLFLARLQQNIPEWWQIDLHRIFMTFRVGISYNTQIPFESRLHEADFVICYENKNHHKSKQLNPFRAKSFGNHHLLRQHVHAALVEHHVLAHLQPIFSLQHNKLAGFEVLARLFINKKIAYPIDFLNIVNEDHLHKKLLTEILAIISKLNLFNSHLRLNINIPPQLLTESKNAAQWLLEQIQRVNIPIYKITLEIIESIDFDESSLKEQVQLLRSYGFRIALDDFGAGYSSLSRLSALKVDSIKIDRTLVIAAANGNIAPIESAVSIAQKHHCSTVAEGIETFKELEVMRRLGVDFIQGYLVGKPVDASIAAQINANSSIEDAMKMRL